MKFSSFYIQKLHGCFPATTFFSNVVFHSHIFSHIFSLRLPHSILPHASLGGGEAINSSACLPCHQWPAHPPSHRPPSRPARTKVCAYTVQDDFLFAWGMACRFVFFRTTNHASFRPSVLNHKKNADHISVFLPVSSVCHAIPLRCSCPVDFEFQVYVIEPHKAFYVHPLTGNTKCKHP